VISSGKEMVSQSMAYTDPEPSDDVLVTRCKTELPHTTRSYEQLVQRHMNRVYHTVYRVVANQEDAEDITQDVFLKVYKHIKKFEQQAAFSTWLYRIATNSALDALDKRKRRRGNPIFAKAQTGEQQAECSDPTHSQTPVEAGPEERAVQKELRECINRVLKQLDREQAEVLVMRDLEDLSYDEISGILGAGLSAVKMRIHRARLAFQKVFLQLCGQAQLAFSVTTQHQIPSQQKKGDRHEL
jgi:RNA polymerase sigma-70 factor (ECF subfamily)